MAEVYRAEDRVRGCLVAIKVMKSSQLGDPVALERFRREAESLVRAGRSLPGRGDDAAGAPRRRGGWHRRAGFAASRSSGRGGIPIHRPPFSALVGSVHRGRPGIAGNRCRSGPACCETTPTGGSAIGRVHCESSGLHTPHSVRKQFSITGASHASRAADRRSDSHTNPITLAHDLAEAVAIAHTSSGRNSADADSLPWTDRLRFRPGRQFRGLHHGRGWG